MRFKKVTRFLLGVFLFPLSFAHGVVFIQNRAQLKPYKKRSNVVMVTSCGRSGSSMLSNALEKNAPHLKILKSHFLPNFKPIKGKIIFVFSDPNKAAESALHLTIRDGKWGSEHFSHIEGSDHEWLARLGSTENQTEENNLLSYDALGYTNQLKAWLSKKVAKPQKILAVKYEDLWQSEVINEIKSFLTLDAFELPPHKTRGYSKEELDPKEIIFKSIYNSGSEEDPKYPAYAEATKLWRTAPSFLYLAPIPLTHK